MSECTDCGYDKLQGLPRLDYFFPYAWAAALVFLSVGLWRRSAVWLVAGAIAAAVPVLGRLFGGIYWWGGLRCRRCGHSHPYR